MYIYTYIYFISLHKEKERKKKGQSSPETSTLNPESLKHSALHPTIPGKPTPSPRFTLRFRTFKGEHY